MVKTTAILGMYLIRQGMAMTGQLWMYLNKKIQILKNKRIIFWIIFGAICGIILWDKSSYGDPIIYVEGAAVGAIFGFVIGKIFERKKKDDKKRLDAGD